LSEALGMTILHSLWQGLLIYLLLRVVLGAVPSLGSGGRYNLSVTALMGITLWSTVTLISQLYNQNWADHTAVTAQGIYPLSLKTLGASAIRVYNEYSISLRPQLPFISLLYVCGLLLQFTRLMYGREQIKALKKTLIPDQKLTAQVKALADRLRISKPVQAGISNLATVPCVADYLKPVLFLPATLFTCLSAQEVEAILVHELAHIKRHDHLVNYFQQLITAVMFYNPFVWLTDRLISAERENCCDDIVVTLTGQPLHYAYALLKLQEAQQQPAALALSATGKDHKLLNRIQRIMTTKKPAGNVRQLALSLVLLTGSICSIAWFNPEFKDGKLVVKHIDLPAVLHTFSTDTLPKPPKPRKPAKPVKAKAPLSPASVKMIKGNKVYYFNDAKMDRLSKEVDRYSAILDKYYNDPKFKQLEKDLDRTGAEMDKMYNSPAIKQLQDDLDKQSSLFDALNDAPEIAKNNAEIEKLSTKIDKYFNSAEYKAALKRYERASRELGNFSQFDTKYKERQREFQEAADAYNKLAHASWIVEYQDQMRKLGEKTREFYSSPEYLKQRDRIRSLSDSLRQNTNSPQMAAINTQMKRLTSKLRTYQNSAELKTAQANLKKATDNLRRYMNSAEYKKRMAVATGMAVQPVAPEQIEIIEPETHQ
jgi:bla regulator protein blaR1